MLICFSLIVEFITHHLEHWLDSKHMLPTLMLVYKVKKEEKKKT